MAEADEGLIASLKHDAEVKVHALCGLCSKQYKLMKQEVPSSGSEGHIVEGDVPPEGGEDLTPAVSIAQEAPEHMAMYQLPNFSIPRSLSSKVTT